MINTSHNLSHFYKYCSSSTIPLPIVICISFERLAVSAESSRYTFTVFAVHPMPPPAVCYVHKTTLSLVTESYVVDILKEGEVPPPCLSTPVSQSVPVQHFAASACAMSVLVQR